jgi:hypothetical protein
MHIADEGQRAWARERERRIEQTLVGEAPVVVPGIELVSQAPRASELRYANAGDESEARALAQALEPILGGELSVRKIAAANVSPRTFELWISKSAASGA